MLAFLPETYILLVSQCPRNGQELCLQECEGPWKRRVSQYMCMCLKCGLVLPRCDLLPQPGAWAVEEPGQVEKNLVLTCIISKKQKRGGVN